MDGDERRWKKPVSGREPEGDDAQLRDLSFGVDLMKRQTRCLRYGSFRVRAGMPVAPFLTFGCKLDDRPFRVSKCFDSSSDQPADGSPFAHIQRMG